jgi:hypothetical protein
MSKRNEPNRLLPENLNDNKIINQLIDLHAATDLDVVLVTKDINMRLKARACGIAAEDYSTDQLVDDVSCCPMATTHDRLLLGPRQQGRNPSGPWPHLASGADDRQPAGRAHQRVHHR